MKALSGTSFGEPPSAERLSEAAPGRRERRVILDTVAAARGALSHVVDKRDDLPRRRSDGRAVHMSLYRVRRRCAAAAVLDGIGRWRGEHRRRCHAEDSWLRDGGAPPCPGKSLARVGKSMGLPAQAAADSRWLNPPTGPVPPTLTRSHTDVHETSPASWSIRRGGSGRSSRRRKRGSWR